MRVFLASVLGGCIGAGLVAIWQHAQEVGRDKDLARDLNDEGYHWVGTDGTVWQVSYPTTGNTAGFFTTRDLS